MSILRHLARHLTELTALRDRVLLERHLAQLLATHYAARQVRLCRRDGARWAVVAVDGTPRRDAAPSAVRALREPVLLQGAALHLAEPRCHSLVPLGPDLVVEFERGRECGGECHGFTDELLRVYRNVIGLLDYGERDSLTGLFNRKTFEGAFMRMAAQPADAVRSAALPSLRRQWRPCDPGWLAVLDIDHFKRVNDEHGHLVGDEVLLLVAQLMRDSFRQGDLLYRFGGEEFVVLMRCPDAEAAFGALERMRQRTESTPFPRVGRLTASFGFTRVDGDDTPELAFGRADKAVYAAKEGGRNQVRHYDDLLADGMVEAEVAGGVDFF